MKYLPIIFKVLAAIMLISSVFAPYYSHENWGIVWVFLGLNGLILGAFGILFDIALNPHKYKSTKNPKDELH